MARARIDELKQQQVAIAKVAKPEPTKKGLLDQALDVVPPSKPTTGPGSQSTIVGNYTVEKMSSLLGEVLRTRQLTVDASKPEGAIAACIAACDPEPQCLGFEINVVNGKCYLYKKVDTKTEHGGFISGVRSKVLVSTNIPGKTTEIGSALRPGSVFRDCPECPEMVVVPVGSFTMGSPAGEPERRDGEDQVSVTIGKPFAVGRLAVTRGEFAAFVAATGHAIGGGCRGVTGSEVKEVASRDWRSPGFTQTDRHPVVCVNWDDAKAYAAWLSSSTGKSYRLLSEAEREYVARAGSTTPFWWGTTPSTSQANYNGDRTYAGGTTGEFRKATVPVDSFAANAWGLYNVHGNVWDWTEDCWNANNAGNPGDGTARTTGDCTFRVPRGGSWIVFPQVLRSAYRNLRFEHGKSSNTVGFRVARTL
jgi:formylglycine-generating enzyme required for sulfatase activity